MNVSQKFFMMSFDWRYCCLVNDHGFCSYNQASKDFFQIIILRLHTDYRQERERQSLFEILKIDRESDRETNSTNW